MIRTAITTALVLSLALVTGCDKPTEGTTPPDDDSGQTASTDDGGKNVFFDDTADMTPVVVRIAEFSRNESCGQCVPCRVGTVRQHEVMVQLQRQGTLAADRIELIDDMARAMGDASICGLGHTASGAVQSALRLGLIGGSS